jgi:1,4-alpha-glucan branching enzyme
MNSKKLSADLQKLVEARHSDPFSILGRQDDKKGVLVRAFLPHAEEVTIAEGGHRLERIEGTGIFEWRGKSNDLPARYRFIWRDDQRREHIGHDPYCYPPQLPDFDLHLFGQGKHWHAHRLLGARVHECEGVAGVLFSVWAPSAERASVVGDFNRWDGRAHPMRVHGNGVWELFIPDLPTGIVYKYEIRGKDGSIQLKADPYGRRFELRPKTASIVEPPSTFAWNDTPWLDKRAAFDWQHEPMSIYEVHLGSWQRGPEGELLNYRELAPMLVDHSLRLGFTHIELMPVTEHPYDKSWGYQTTGYYAPTSRFGSPDDFRWFVDHCHRNGIGVILDWVPAHFPKDAHGLGRFDGTALYEHEDPRLGEHLDWSTLIFNFGRYEVKNFLISSALFWLEEFHIDGLRVDAVASMLYLDYSRKAGEWAPNPDGSNDNRDAVRFLQSFNERVYGLFPGVVTVAEESTAWAGVTLPTSSGGLGFGFKWNMGWMNDTLRYMSSDPVYRKWRHNELTFGLLYAFAENFVLPLSHDEVVHGKGSILAKTPGDEWRRFAGVRAYYGFMWGHPGKKLLFMGQEFGQTREWDDASELDWGLLHAAPHRGLRDYVRDLNRLYRAHEALHARDCESEGFEWVVVDDAESSVFAFLRYGADRARPMLVVCNFTPVPRHAYRLGLPRAGRWREILNSDAPVYGGSGLGNLGAILARPDGFAGFPAQADIEIPPLAALYFEFEGECRE